MNKIIKIHGCSGAGKTTVVRQLIERAEWKWYTPFTYIHRGNPFRNKYLEMDLPEVDRPVFVLGSYENTCGGVDTIHNVDHVAELIDQLIPEGHVIFEGLLTSTYYGNLGKHSERYKGRYGYAFLDTPIEVCLERVRVRRLMANNAKPMNEQPTRDKHRVIGRLQEKVTAMGHDVILLPHLESAYNRLVGYLDDPA